LKRRDHTRGTTEKENTYDGIIEDSESARTNKPRKEAQTTRGGVEGKIKQARGNEANASKIEGGKEKIKRAGKPKPTMNATQ